MPVEHEPDVMREANEVVARLNVDSVSPDIDLAYFRNRDLRVLLRTGDLISTAAKMKGVDLDLSDQAKGNEWINLIPEGLMPSLRNHGVDTARSVLKEARRLANSSQLNGDKEGVLDTLRVLIGGLGRNKELTLPAIPGKTVEISSPRL